MKAFYVETRSLGGLAWPQLMCCALDLLSADACKSRVWQSLPEEPEMARRRERELVSANLLGSHKVNILVEGTQIPLTLLYTIQECDAMHNRETDTCESPMLWWTRSPVRPGRPVMITKGNRSLKHMAK
jgi:hypothetical protein